MSEANALGKESRTHERGDFMAVLAESGVPRAPDSLAIVARAWIVAIVII
jgi:hypothetical protein